MDCKARLLVYLLVEDFAAENVNHEAGRVNGVLVLFRKRILVGYPCRFRSDGRWRRAGVRLEFNIDLATNKLRRRLCQ